MVRAAAGSEATGRYAGCCRRCGGVWLPVRRRCCVPDGCRELLCRRRRGGGMVTDCRFEDGALCRIAVGCCGAGRIPCCRVYCGPHGLTVIAVGWFGGCCGDVGDVVVPEVVGVFGRHRGQCPSDRSVVFQAVECMARGGSYCWYDYDTAGSFVWGSGCGHIRGWTFFYKSCPFASL